MGLWMNLDIVIDIDVYVGGSRANIDVAKDFIDEFGNAEGCCSVMMEWDYVNVHVRDEDRGTIPDVYLNKVQSIVAEYDFVRSYSLLWNPDWAPDKLMWKSRMLLDDDLDDDFGDDEDEFEVWIQM